MNVFYNGRKETRYERLKRQGICTACGKKEATDGGLCKTCRGKMRAAWKRSWERNGEKERARVRERYYYLKSRGICTVCGSADAYNGRTRCPECLGKARKSFEKMHEKKGNDYFVSMRRKRREMLKSQGLCVVCGKEKAIAGITTCGKCRKKQRDSQKRTRAKKEQHLPRIEKADYGICPVCNSPIPPDFKHRVCPKCHERLTRQARERRAKIRKEREEKGT